MSVTVNDFWKLLAQSRLLTPEQVKALHAEYRNTNGGSPQGNSQALIDWLISRNALTRYQSKVIDAGRAGPFYYGDYKVYDRIEKGPLSGTFRAIHAPTSHPVVLKFVPGEASRDMQQWQRLVDRIQSQVGLVHPNLNQIYEPVDLQSFKFVAMQEPPGEALEQRIGNRSLRPRDACRVVRMAALGLKAMHEAGQVHGDVRPRNLWLQNTGNVLLMRDPLFQPTTLHEAQTDDSGDLAARADYMAPEFGQQGKSPDTLTDIYALGCTLYRLLSGRPPFAGGDVMQKIGRHASEPIEPLEEFKVPPQIGQLVAYMMAKNPPVRYQDAGVVAEQLTPFVDPPQLKIQPPNPPQTLSSYQQWIKQKGSSPAGQFAIEEPQPGAFSGIAVNAESRAKRDAAKDATTGVAVSAPQASAGTFSAAERFKRKMSTKKKIIMASSLGGGLLALLLIVMIVANSGDKPEVAENGEGEKDKDQSTEVVGKQETPQDDEQPEDGGNGQTATPPDDSAAWVQEVQDSESLPWASPTTGPPITLTYVPPNPGMILVARPAELMAAESSAKVIQALGPDFEAARQQWEDELGVPFSGIEQVIASFHEAARGPPRSAFVVRLVEPIAEQTLLAKWGNPQPVSVPDAETHFFSASNGWSFYLPREDPNQAVDLIVMGDAEDVEGAAIHGKTGTQALMLPQMKQILKWSDETRHFTCLFEPNLMYTEFGQKLFTDSYAKIRESLDWFLGGDIQVAMVSFHVGDRFYLELRGNPMSGRARDVKEYLEDRLGGLFFKVTDYLAEMGPSPHWTKLRTRYPTQLQLLNDFTRVGIEAEQVLVNSYMPLKAAHNLIAGTELAVAAPTGATSTASPTPTRPAVTSLDELLQQKLDVVDIPSADLINAVADVKAIVLDTYRNLPFEFDIWLVGPELKEEGITQNQRVSDFRMEDATVSEVLTGMMMTANPVTTVKEPTETDQKLVWALGPDPKDPSRTILLITTRKATQENSNYQLGKPFQP